MKLRDYQQSAVDAAITWLKYKDTPAIINLPTGSGKSHVIAALIEHYHALGKRIILLANRKELLEQTGSKINIPIGYYSASIGEKNLNEQVTVAGIQSIYNQDIEPVDIIIIDECHGLPNCTINDYGKRTGDGQYWQFIAKHPQAKIIGLSATPYRTKGGKLEWGEEVYKIDYKTLLDAGYLAPLSNKLISDVTPNLEDVQVKLGEYVQAQLEIIMEDPKLIDAAVRAIIAYSVNRHSVLIFCVSVAHGHLIAKALSDNGIEGAIMVDGKTAHENRSDAIKNFKHEFGNVRYLINCELFLVGFDAPNVDMIVCLRPTKSKVLSEQMMGRGVRIAPGKTNCLLVDMAGNLEEHGPIGSPFREKAKKEAPPNGKICPECEEYVKPTARECPDCGYQWPETEAPKVKHNYEANQEGRTVHSNVYDVTDVRYSHHKSKKGNDTLKITYYCDYGKYGNIAEFYSPWSHSEWARDKVWRMFKERGHELVSPVETYDMESLLWHCQYLSKPVRITVDHSKEFPEITRFEWAEDKNVETGGSGDTAGIGELLDDEIPF